MSLLKGKQSVLKRVRGIFIIILFVSLLSGSVLTSQYKTADATICTPCILCIPIDPPIAAIILELLQELFWDPLIQRNIEDHLNYEQNWIIDDFFDDFWRYGVGELTELLAAHGMYQMQIVGAFFDAKNHIETTRLSFQLHAEAHKDYHPSDDFCWFGTNARSLASSDARRHLNVLALSERSLQRHIGYVGSSSAEGPSMDKESRWNQFVDTYCDPKDNGWHSNGSGLDFACDRDGSGSGVAAGATDLRRVNRDVDYTALVEEPRTLDMDFSDTTATLSDDAEDVMALAQNLYGHTSFTNALSETALKDNAAAQELYLDMRSVVAKRNVAEHSFNSIVAMKSSGTNGDPTAPSTVARPDVGTYTAAIMRELMPVGTDEADIVAMMGENPSYYAQLEILAKKIYQNPDFFANLYDKPMNVKRKSVAMKAIELMIDRALLESEMRQEMLLSVMLSGKLQQKHSHIDYRLKKEEVR